MPRTELQDNSISVRYYDRNIGGVWVLHPEDRNGMLWIGNPFLENTIHESLLNRTYEDVTKERFEYHVSVRQFNPERDI